MLRIRLGLCALAIVAIAVVLTTAGHTQTLSGWNPANVTAVDRGVSPLVDGITARQSPRRPGLRPHERRGRNGAIYVPGRVIVKFRDTASAQSRVSAMSQVSRTASLMPHSAGALFDTVSVDESEDAEAVAAAFAARPDVEYAQPQYRVYPYQTFVPNDPGYAKLQWNFPAIDLERAWAIQQGGNPSIVVAVLDTGMAFTSGMVTHHAYAFCYNAAHDVAYAPPCDAGDVSLPDLGTLTMPVARASDLATADSRFVSPWDFIWNTPVPIDFDGHGTHVSSTVGELTNNNFDVAGVAFNVSLMPVKVIDSNWDDIFNSPNQGTDSSVAAGIQYAADHGAKVINMSIGRTGPANCGTVAQLECAPVVEAAIRYAVAKGCFIAIAAGNDGDSLPAGQVEVMAEIASRVNGAVSVAALNRQNTRASYSTSGPYVELAAPGGDGADYIAQQTYDFFVTNTFDPTIPGEKYGPPRFDMFGIIGYEGTSMATPHVSGLAALLMAQGITDPATIEAVLEHFATDRGAPGRDNLYGYGEISARNTLRGLGLAQ